MIPERSTILDPVRDLLDEHVLFMGALEELVTVTATLDAGSSRVDPTTLDALQRLVGRVDEHLNVHFLKEEEIFFPAIERHFPTARVKFQFLHVDHDRLRDAFEIFIQLVQNARHGRLAEDGFAELARLAGEMVRLFYYHIVAEDVVYLDVAAELLSTGEAETLGRQMHALEERLRERCAAVSP